MEKKDSILKAIILFVIKKIASVVITIFVMIFMIIIFSVISTKNMSTDNKVDLSKSKYLFFRFDRFINEKPDENIFFNDKKENFSNVLSAIENGKNDTTVKGIVLQLDMFTLSSAHTEEITQKLEEFKKTNKKIYAYGNYITNSSYNLALVADEIIMPPTSSSMFNLTGYYINMPYLKKLTEKIGVSYSVINIGNYKTYGENYIKENMSDELKSELVRIYDKRYNNFINKISLNRDMSEERIKTLIESGKLASSNSFLALEEKLIDRVTYYDDFKLELTKKNTILLNYLAYNKTKLNFAKGPKIGVIYAEGPILMADNGGKNINYSTMYKNIEKVIKDKTIKGVVLRVNSPGGSALASELILNSLNRLKEERKLKIYVSMGSVAASGGYYISANGEKIFADKNTITGSIGVISLFPNIEKLSDKIGVNFEKIQKGKYSNLYDLTRKPSQDEINYLKIGMKQVYSEFKTRVAEGRNLKEEEVEKIAQGRIWTGEEAVEIGLVDEIGTLQDTIDQLAQDLNLKRYSVEEIYDKENIFEKIKNKDFDLKVFSDYEIDELKYLIEEYKIIKSFDKKPITYFPYNLNYMQ